MIIHLKYTEYIFIYSFNKYLLDIHYVLGIILGFEDIEEKSIQQCKMTFLNHYISKPCFINNVTFQHSIPKTYKEAHNFEV